MELESHDLACKRTGDPYPASCMKHHDGKVARSLCHHGAPNKCALESCGDWGRGLHSSLCPPEARQAIANRAPIPESSVNGHGRDRQVFETKQHVEPAL